MIWNVFLLVVQNNLKVTRVVKNLALDVEYVQIKFKNQEIKTNINFAHSDKK